MKHLELHILQSFPVVCLNRDDNNSPKTAIFGGAQRARVSSQSWKRAIRQRAEELQGKYFAGKRTRLVAGEIKKRLSAKGKDEISEALSMAISHYVGTLDSKNIGKVKTMMFFSPEEYDKIVNALLSLQEEDAQKIVDAYARIDMKSLDSDEESEEGEAEEKTPSKAKRDDDKKMSAKSFMKLISGILKKPIGSAFKGKHTIAVKDAADIALFGRMVANDHSLTLEGAAMFAHALSTHRVDNEIDYFSAVDDKQPEGESGAGMTGTLEFNSATYYRFAALNLDLLMDKDRADKDHLGGLDTAGRRDVVRAFIEATLTAVPIARRNSMNGHVLPGHVLGIVRGSGHPVQFVNAFEKPVRVDGTGGLFEASVKMLEDEHKRLNHEWELDKRQLASVTMPGKTLSQFLDELTAHVD
jgi:CRISPR system Cascade subunit CasC